MPRLLDYLVGIQWSVQQFTDTEQASNDAIIDYKLKFREDGSMIAYNTNTEITGRWHPSRDCNYIVIDMDRNSAVHSLSGVWKIETHKDNVITLVYEKMSKKKTLEIIRN